VNIVADRFFECMFLAQWSRHTHLYLFVHTVIDSTISPSLYDDIRTAGLGSVSERRL
jgi:hypothetical protein